MCEHSEAQRSALSIFLSHASSYVLRQALSLNLELAHWQTVSHQAIEILFWSPQPRITDAHHHALCPAFICPSSSSLVASSSCPVPAACPAQSGSQLTYGGDGLAEGHKAKAVLEDTSAMEERKGDAHDLLQPVLDPAQPGSRGVLNLVEQVVLPKGEDRHKSCPRGTQERTDGRTQEGMGGKQLETEADLPP